MSNAEGNFSGEPINQEEIKKQKINEWHNKNPDHKIVRNDYYKLLQYAVGILAFGILIFGYVALNDKLKTEVNFPNIPECPTITIPNCPANNFSCTPTLNCGEVIIPSNLTVSLINSS